MCISCVASGPDAPAMPVVPSSAIRRRFSDQCDTDRFLKLTGQSAFGHGVYVLPFLQKHDATVVRLTCKLLNVAVNRRTWRAEVRLMFSFCIGLQLLTLLGTADTTTSNIP